MGRKKEGKGLKADIPVARAKKPWGTREHKDQELLAD